MRKLLAGPVVALLVLVLAPPGAAFAAEAPATTIGPLVATARLGEPVTFSTTLQSAVRPTAVELLTRTPGQEGTSVLRAAITDAGGGAFAASLELDGHATPNTTVLARFRAQLPAGDSVVGPEERITVVDDRFEWQTLEGALVRLHWYEGDQAFGERALQIGEEAIARATDLLGVEETEPIDFFIYASETPFREALGPGTRENVGGQANASIRTLFGLIEPNEIESDWVDVLVTHEITHLVFATSTDNPYHGPPRWLNEGLAVYLSEGYAPRDRGAVQSAAGRGDLLPITALGGLFPTTRERFNLAYAESVSAVDFFIRTHGEAQLVALIRSYADGVTDDDAFSAATGEDLDAFNAAWLQSLGAAVPQPFGPQPAPPGPVPSGWPGAAPAPAPTAAPQPSNNDAGSAPSASLGTAPGEEGQEPASTDLARDPLTALAQLSGPLALALAIIFLAAVLLFGLIGVSRRPRGA